MYANTNKETNIASVRVKLNLDSLIDSSFLSLKDEKMWLGGETSLTSNDGHQYSPAEISHQQSR